MDFSKIDNFEFEDVDYDDYPDFCDAYISHAELDGVELTDEQYEEVNDDSGFVYDKLMDHLH